VCAADLGEALNPSWTGSCTDINSRVYKRTALECATHDIEVTEAESMKTEKLVFHAYGLLDGARDANAKDRFGTDDPPNKKAPGLHRGLRSVRETDPIC
jgi:hypothetical protein